MKYINIKLFIISLAVGIFLTYITTAPPSIIYVYPTPENIDKIQYKDDSDTCYSFKYKNVTCPNDSSKIRKYPVQKINSNM
tara:strand:- start:4344 stop:4586 length:243 start_codon:yes stop_codon:yes gene_type:complete